ncbi:hypothetical protein VSO92_01440 [Myroides pelagicus]|uniref:hypothetical protein n=1 Tax=Myroides pelagicus TaxID=270914 RepID=UPI002DB8AD81|nr:hypothetical protein [Myroides pelagicus]MEC4112777.1 hypothetical protein [Myroides pelagicus]
MIAKIQLKLNNDILLTVIQMVKQTNDYIIENVTDALLISVKEDLITKLEDKAKNIQKQTSILDHNKKHSIILKYHEAYSLFKLIQSVEEKGIFNDHIYIKKIKKLILELKDKVDIFAKEDDFRDLEEETIDLHMNREVQTNINPLLFPVQETLDQQENTGKTPCTKVIDTTTNAQQPLVEKNLENEEIDNTNKTTIQFRLDGSFDEIKIIPNCNDLIANEQSELNVTSQLDTLEKQEINTQSRQTKDIPLENSSLLFSETLDENNHLILELDDTSKENSKNDKLQKETGTFAAYFDFPKRGLNNDVSVTINMPSINNLDEEKLTIQGDIFEANTASTTKDFVEPKNSKSDNKKKEKKNNTSTSEGQISLF